MTPLPEIRKPVATRSALPFGVIRKGASMPPYFNLLLIIFADLGALGEILVHIIYCCDFSALAAVIETASQNGSLTLKKASMPFLFGKTFEGWCLTLT